VGCPNAVKPASSQPVCVQLTGTARQKPLKLFGPSVAPVVLFVSVVSSFVRAIERGELHRAGRLARARPMKKRNAEL
jgi:hypothetical protein